MSFLQAALGLKDESKIDVGANQVRVDLQSRSEMWLGFLPFSLLKEHGAEVIFRARELRVNGQRRPKMLDGLCQPALPKQNFPQITMSLG